MKLHSSQHFIFILFVSRFIRRISQGKMQIWTVFCGAKCESVTVWYKTGVLWKDYLEAVRVASSLSPSLSLVGTKGTWPCTVSIKPRFNHVLKQKQSYGRCNSCVFLLSSSSSSSSHLELSLNLDMEKLGTLNLSRVRLKHGNLGNELYRTSELWDTLLRQISDLKISWRASKILLKIHF